MKKTKKKYRLKKWAQTVWATVWTLSFVFLVGLDTVDFSFTTIALIFADMCIFSLCAYMLGKYGRLDD